MTNMNIKCPKCLKIFQPEKKDEKLLIDAINKKQSLFMMKCPFCYKSIPINPCDLMSAQERIDEEVIECPICKEGIISYIDDDTEQFWGCGECGNVWFSKAELDKEIKHIL